MNILDLMMLSFSALKERKLRAVLTIAMVAIGAGLVTALSGMTNGLYTYMLGQFSTLGANIVIVMPASSSFRINEPVRDSIERIANVKDVAPFIQQVATLESGGTSKATTIIGIDQNKLPLIFPTVQIAEGSLIPPHDAIGIVVGNTVAYPPGQSTPFLRYHQSVIVKYTYQEGVKLVTDTRSFQVKGILSYMGTSAMFIPIDRMAAISLHTANSLFKRGGSYDALFVIATDADAVEDVVSRIKKIYENNVEAISAKSIIQIVQNIMGALQVFIGGIAGVSLVVASVGILAGLYTSVMERTREIGLLKALGFKSWMILMLFLDEAILIGMIGGAVGCGVGIILAHILAILSGQVRGAATSQMPGMEGGFGFVPPVFTSDIFMFVWLFCVGLSVVAGVYPAWRASRFDPVIALRKD